MPEAGPRVVLVHGAGAGGWEWAAWARVFEAEGWQVHAPDLQPSPAGLAATTFDDYLAQVRAWCEAGPRPRLLVGASLGGLLARAAADRAAALVLINPLPPGGPPGRAWPAVVPWGRTASLAGTRRALGPEADDATAAWAWRRWRDESGQVLAGGDPGRAMPQPAGPVLVIASEADEDVPAGGSRDWAAQWGAECWVEPGGHLAPLLGRQAAALAARVRVWADGAGDRARAG